MTTDRRDRRQFKAAPYQNPKVFPPPTAEAWAELDTSAPVKSSEAAHNKAGRIFRRQRNEAAAVHEAASTEFEEASNMVALVNRTEVRAKEMVITPAVAAGWLEKMATNRKLSENTVNKYADDMREGRWLSNGSTIVMGKSGQILDGQHRLHAIIKADVAVSMIVVSGVDDEAFATIDTGRGRSVADVLMVMGQPNWIHLAGLARAWACYEQTGEFSFSNMNQVSHQYLIALALENAERFQAALRGSAGVRVALKGSSGVWAALWIIFGEIDALDRDMFYEGLHTGENLSSSNPMFALRRLMLERAARRNGAQLPQNILAAHIIKAWNKFRAHESAGLIRWGAGEAFPEPV